jgi:hypothetical protein
MKKAIAKEFAELEAARHAAEHHLVALDLVVGAAKPKHRRTSLARIAKQANKTGNVIERKPDGTIVVMPKPVDDVSPEPDNDLDKWLAKRHAH